MLFPRINRSSAEKVFASFQNISGATMSPGYPGVLDIVATTVDGNRVSKPATATLSLFIGLAAETLADATYGKFQVYGYNASAYLTNDTSVAVAAGDILVPVNAQNYFGRSAAGNGTTGLIMALEAFATATTPAAAQKKVFIRAL